MGKLSIQAAQLLIKMGYKNKKLSLRYLYFSGIVLFGIMLFLIVDKHHASRGVGADFVDNLSSASAVVVESKDNANNIMPKNENTSVADELMSINDPLMIKNKIRQLSSIERRNLISSLISKIKISKTNVEILRCLDVLSLVVPDADDQMHELTEILQKMISSSYPPVVRGAIRALSNVETSDAYNILAENLNQSDESLSAEVMGSIAKYSNNKKFKIDNDDLAVKITNAYEYYIHNGQGTEEIVEATARSLEKIISNKSFEYLVSMLEDSKINLSLKNEIASNLPNWGVLSELPLKKYLQYLKALQIETNAFSDQYRLDGIKITEAAILKVSHK